MDYVQAISKGFNGSWTDRFPSTPIGGEELRTPSLLNSALLEGLFASAIPRSRWLSNLDLRLFFSAAYTKLFGSEVLLLSLFVDPPQAAQAGVSTRSGIHLRHTRVS